MTYESRTVDYKIKMTKTWKGVLGGVIEKGTILNANLETVIDGRFGLHTKEHPNYVIGRNYYNKIK